MRTTSAAAAGPARRRRSTSDASASGFIGPIVYCAIMASATQRVAARVVELRQARGLSQEALAKKTGLNRVTLARLERALHPPNLDTLDRIARALRVKLADLVR